MAELYPTADPETFLEAEQGDTKIYVCPANRLRWSVRGVCDKRGLCMIGAVVESPDGDDVTIKSVRQLGQLAEDWGRGDHIQTDEPLDVPTGPNYDQSCCPFEIEVLPYGD